MENRSAGNGNQGSAARTEGGRNPLENLGAQIPQQIEQLRGRFDEVVDQTAEFTRTRPGTSLLIAATAGYLIGRILRS